MSKRDNPLVLILALAATLGLIGGGLWVLSKAAPDLVPNLSSQSQTKAAKGELRILGDTFSGYSTFRSQPFQEALEEVGLKLRYQDEFDQARRAELLNQGKADLLVTTLDQFLQQQPEGQIIGLIDRTVGADAVVLNTKKYPNLKSLLDLKRLVEQERSQGRQLTLTFAGDTPSEYLALVLSTKFEAFKLADFQVKKVADASEAWQLLQDPNQNVAVAVIWEPYVTQAKKQGHTVVLSSQDAPQAIVDVIVASNRLIESQPEKISELLEAYYRRIDANVREPSQLKTQIAEDGELSSSEASAVLQGIDFFTASEAQQWMSDNILEKRIGSTAAVLVLAGRLNDVPQNPQTLFSPQFLTKAANNTETLISLVRADNPELADRLSGKGQTVAAVPQVSAQQITAAPDIGNLEVRGEVKFGVGSATLTNQGQQTLNQLATEIQEFNPQTLAVRVIGHTSKTGAAALNQTLSQQRAQVVVNYLKNRGLKHNFVAEGKGFNQPLPGIPPTDPRQQRTEIRLVRVN
ncbi:MAG: phosphate ABC transporter substrate-binding/OmpA family protein [Coleofasciculus sp. B1-GNL1-01]|uniref:OmpA family protein n=1 Tax=Coleofasciculus sp. B1-GNL1-01 TaxID=3068484 RepID=UPI0033014332